MELHSFHKPMACKHEPVIGMTLQSCLKSRLLRLLFIASQVSQAVTLDCSLTQVGVPKEFSTIDQINWGKLHNQFNWRGFWKECTCSASSIALHLHRNTDKWNTEESKANVVKATAVFLTSLQLIITSKKIAAWISEKIETGEKRLRFIERIYKWPSSSPKTRCSNPADEVKCSNWISRVYFRAISVCIQTPKPGIRRLKLPSKQYSVGRYSMALALAIQSSPPESNSI